MFLLCFIQVDVETWFFAAYIRIRISYYVRKHRIHHLTRAHEIDKQ
jgi:hypothetical protein